MNNLFLVIIIITNILFFSGCDDENSIATEPEDTSYNIAYEDSILFIAPDPSQISTIHIAYINGTGIRPLTSNIISHNPVWSPNKRKILFVGQPVGTGNWGVYQINTSDYKVNLITTNDSNCESASFSPDMKYIAYSLYYQSNNSTLKLFNVSTGTTTTLFENAPEYFTTLSWSPDSKKILLNDGVTINIETKQFEQLFQYGAANSPSWSPDGKKVLFSSGNIFVYNLETNECHVVYATEGTQSRASWSKDNNQIVFDLYPPFNPEDRHICKVNIDGTNFARITYSINSATEPCWYK